MIASMVTTALVTKACCINELGVAAGGAAGRGVFHKVLVVRVRHRELLQIASNGVIFCTVDAPVVERLKDIFAPGNLEVSADRKVSLSSRFGKIRHKEAKKKWRRTRTLGYKSQHFPHA
jgi:hypothetical protein